MHINTPILLLLSYLFPTIALAADEGFVGLPRPGELKDFLRGENRVALPDDAQQTNSRNRSAVSHSATTTPRQDIQRQQRQPVRTGHVLKVGLGQKYRYPSQAANAANHGDIIEIDAGSDYRGDEAIWRASNLLIRGVNGRAKIAGKGGLRNGKGLWVIIGNDTVVENIEFSGAKVSDRNGAGIRLEGRNLEVRYSYFHDNQNGILTGRNTDSHILLEYNEFSRNGAGDGRSHNLYIGEIAELILRFNYIHHAHIGHNVKSRARTNFILYNRIMDEKDGTASYQIDIPNGGMAYVIGNSIQQGERADNWSLISYGAEGLKYPKNELILVNNTLVNDRKSGNFIAVKGDIDVMMINNIFAGRGKLLDSRLAAQNNLIKINPLFKARKNFDYHLLAGSLAIDKGELPVRYNGVKLMAEYEYVHKAKAGLRQTINKPDYGAFEYLPK